MKRMFGIAFTLGLVFSATVFAQTANFARNAVIREANAYVNGCGQDGAPQWFISTLNAVSGNSSACNQHDIDYMTLGMSKASADNNLFAALGVSRLSMAQSTIAGVFWTAVSGGGDAAYNNAQRQAREEFRRIHHGNEWNPGYGKWHPYDGHVRMSFPQCGQSCIR
ncbi:MAG: hypothetical protein LBQ93_11805 [Treponema sp.]|nr:hypothetical protein [Treponema sp.]